MVFVTKTAIARHLKSNHKKEIVPAREAKRSAIGDDAGPSKKARTEEVRNRFQCTVCSKVCLSVRGLNRHAVVHKGKSARVQVTCNFCDQSFASEDDKRGHVSSYHRIAVALNDDDGDKANDGGVIPNTVCEINVKEEDEKENIKDIPDVDPFIEADTETKKPRRRAASAKKKAAVVKKESNAAFPCEDCDKKFEKKSSYVRHRNSDHCPSKDFVCDVCQKAFATEVVLKRHKGNVHRVRVKRTGVDGKGGEEKKEDPFTKWYVFADGQKHLKCDQCKYNSLWYHKGRFLEHYRIHTGEKPFTCDLCGKQFRTKTLLQKHVMFVHEGIKEHPCDICGRCFSDKRYMEDHRRIHTGERPYVCDLCGKTFKQSASLFIHKELHKGLRKHGCEMCGKRFTTRSSLTIHIKRHVGERNFICATCGKAFVDGKHLKDHMAVHSEERPFSCELCGGRFKLMKHLKQHGRTHKRDYIV